MRARTGIAAMVCALAGAGGLPVPASAHPLGNFTTNQLVEVRIDRDAAHLHYVLDQAEIPTFQQVQRLDTDGNGTIEGAEEGAVLDEALDEARSGLELRAAGRPVRIGPAENAELSYPPGQGGLSLTRVEADFTATLPPGAAELQLANRAYPDRTGWQAIEILPGEGTDVASSVPATEPTDELRSYPQDLLSSPPDDREASFEVSPGSGGVTAPQGLDGGATTENRALDGFANTLAGGDTHGLLILFLLAAAFGWGALHALSPGARQDAGGRLPGRLPRHAASRGDPRANRDRDAHRRRVRVRARDPVRLAVRPARADLPVAQRRLGPAGGRDRLHGDALPPEAVADGAGGSRG